MAKMNGIISVSTIAYDGYNLGTALRRMSQIGCSHVELDAIEGLSEHIRLQDFRDKTLGRKVNVMMKQSHVSSIGFSGHMDLSKEGIVPAFEKKMRFAKQIGAKIINTFSGPRERIGIFYKNIKHIAEFAKSMDLVVALETHGDIISDRSSLDVIKKINLENVRINYDFANYFHYAKGNVDLEKDFESTLKYVVYLHVKDTVLEGNKWHFTQIGKGTIDYREIFRILKTCNREIPMSIELPLRLEVSENKVAQKTKAPLQIESIDKIVTDSISYVRGLWKLA